MKNKGKYKSGFKTPENYFEQLEDRIMDAVQEGSLPESTGFSVPDNYFKEVEDKIMERVSLEKEVKVIPLFRRKAFIYTSSIAACLALVFTLYMNNVATTVTLSEIADAEIEAYLEESGMEYDSYDIAQLLSEEDIQSLPTANTLFSEESLEDYLLENLDDTTLLIE